MAVYEIETNVEQVTCPEELGIDSKTVKAFVNECEEKNYNFKNIVIGRNGKVGTRISKKPYDPKYPNASFSASKPVVAIAVGYAIAEGILTLDTTIEDVFGSKLTEKQIEKNKGITVEHLITMMAGKNVSLLSNKEKSVWFDLFINGKRKYEPGEKFFYLSENTYILGRMITERTGLSISEFLTPRLFEPLEIEKPFWEIDTEGYEAGAWGLYWKTEDMVKIAILFLNGGVWNGKQVLSKEWIDTMTSLHIPDINTLYTEGLGFGYQTWANYDKTYYRFEGLYGQYIFFYPHHDAFVVIQSGDIKQYDIFPLVDKYFPETFKDTPLSVSQEDAQDYKQFIENISYDMIKPGPRNFAMEANLSGRSYKLFSNKFYTMQTTPILMVQSKAPGKMDNLKFDFFDGYAVMSYTERNYGKSEIIINLDGEERVSTIHVNYNENHAVATGKWLPNRKLQVQVILLETPEVKTFEFSFGKRSIKIGLKAKTTLAQLVKFRLIFNGLHCVKLVEIIGALAQIVGYVLFYPFVTFGVEKKNKDEEQNKS